MGPGFFFFSQQLYVITLSHSGLAEERNLERLWDGQLLGMLGRGRLVREGDGEDPAHVQQQLWGLAVGALLQLTLKEMKTHTAARLHMHKAQTSHSYHYEPLQIHLTLGKGY